MNLKGRRVVLGVSGGIAAYKAVELCRRLMDVGAFVSPVLTDNATRFIGAATFDALASEPARVSMWESPEPSPHTTLGQQADVIVVAPATARIIASYALGTSDDLLATTLLATRAPVVMCPAMHTEMWEQPAVQANVALLRERGVTIVEPESGHLAGGDQGVGRLANIDTIVSVASTIVMSHVLSGLHDKHQSKLVGKRVVVTAGGTREPIDPVRFIGNRSSGKQGYAVAVEAAERGADVVLITASNLPLPSGVVSEHVETAQEMHEAVLRYLPEADVVVMAAAIADFRPSNIVEQKIKKHEGIPQITLEPTIDVLTAIAEKRRDDQIIVGFAAETDNVEQNMTNKLKAKNLDLIVGNDVSEPGAGMEHDTNSVTILDRTGQKSRTGLVEKRTVAVSLLDAAERLLGGHAGSQAWE